MKKIYSALVILGTLGAIENSDDSFMGPKSNEIQISHIEGPGIGYDKGYTSLELFLTSYKPWIRNFFPFLDLRGHVFNDGKLASNLGIGTRAFINDYCHSLGANLYYDYRRGARRNYQQIGGGIEFLTPFLEFRVNGYCPIGAQVSHAYDLSFDQFIGNNFLVNRKYEYSLAGVDSEAGWHFKRWGQIDLFFGLGPYYFKGKIDTGFVGGKGRLVARLGEYVSLEGSYSYDSVFRSRPQGQISISIPFGPRSCLSENKCCSYCEQSMLQEWIYTPPYRNEMIVVDKMKKKSLALDPITGLPYQFWFVSNLSSSNGTIESPFSTLAAAEASSGVGDVIYVFPGDGTTNGMNTGITLKDRQRFLGSGVPHFFETTIGGVLIPPHSTLNPSISAAAGAVVTLMNQNEVSGFNIYNGNPGILGAWSGSSVSANVNRNQIYNSIGNGIDLMPTNSQANLLVENNFLFASSGIAINIPFLDSTGTARIENNLVDNSTINGSRGIQMIHDGASNVTNIVTGNTLLNTFEHSIFIDAVGTATPTIVNSIVNGNTFNLRFPPPFGGILVQAIYLRTQNSSTHISTVMNNQIYGERGNARNGILVQASATSQAASRTETNIFGNIIKGSGQPILVHTELGGMGSVLCNINKNDVSNFNWSAIFAAVNGGIALLSEGSGSIEGVLSGNTITNNGTPLTGGAGIHITSFLGLIDVLCEKNVLEDNYGQGISVNAFGATVRTAFISNSVQRDGIVRGENAIDLVASMSGSLQAQFINNTIKDNAARDFFAFTNGAGDSICLKLEGNTIDTGFALDTLTSPGGSIFLEHPNYNIGNFFINGPIIYVDPGTCFP